MPDIQELHNETIAFLSEPPNKLAAKAVPIEGVESLGGEDEQRFSVFIESHLEHALQIAAEFMKIANNAPGDEGLAQVLAAARRLVEAEDNEAIKYALLVFITHHPEGNRLPFPSLEQISPQDIIPSQKVMTLGVEPLGGLGAEAKLDYFREDTAVNFHHIKWHVVYPGRGVPNPNNPGVRILKPRQGELFWYMHQQMLARYDTERKSSGLAITKSLDNFTAPIEEGYDANLTDFGNRLPDLTLRDVMIQGVLYTVSQHTNDKNRLLTAARSGKFQNGAAQVPISDNSMLSNTIESNLDRFTGSNYGNLHNMGHVLIAALSNPSGVMRDPRTAVRDPIFFRWHRLVDDIVFEWQETLAENDFASDAPNVSLRKEPGGDKSPDILLSFKKDIPEAAAPDFDGEIYGETKFGGANWDAPLSTFQGLTEELQTTSKTREFQDFEGNLVRKNYLDFEEFYYFFRLQNEDFQTRKVTVRVFLAASELADNRRFWIEMDKFPVELAANQKKVVFRPARFSSVVRKPAYRPSEMMPPSPVGIPNENYCECGWAYHLILPRGNEDGMNFNLLVMLTDWNLDSVGEEKRCGSMSFCGAKDSDYPDKRPMGYPFDRPFKNLSIDETIAAQKNMATRELKIRFIPSA